MSVRTNTFIVLRLNKKKKKNQFFDLRDFRRPARSQRHDESSSFGIMRAQLYGIGHEYT